MNDVIEWMPESYGPWIWAGIVILLAVIVALVLHAILYFVADRITPEVDKWFEAGTFPKEEAGTFAKEIAAPARYWAPTASRSSTR